MRPIVVAFGSNLGARRDHILRAAERVAAILASAGIELAAG